MKKYYQEGLETGSLLLHNRRGEHERTERIRKNNSGRTGKSI